MKFGKHLPGKRIAAAFLCVILMLSLLPAAAFAWTSEEGHTCTSAYGGFYVASDGDYYYSKDHYSYIVYNEDGTIQTKSRDGGYGKSKYLMTDSSGTHRVYCVEAVVSYTADQTYTSASGTNSNYFRNLPIAAQHGIMMALMYGWREGMDSPVPGTNKDDFAFATQVIIWEYQQQLRTNPTNLAGANGVDADTFCHALKGRPAEKCYNWLLERIGQHYTIPSFAARSKASAQTYTMKYNPSTGKYSITLEDTNGTLADLKFSASGVTVTRDGNLYTFESDTMLDSAITVSAQKDIPLDCDNMLIWGCVGKQTMVSGASDPVFFYLNLETENFGTGRIQKVSEDGKVAGVSFRIAGNGVDKTVTTGADGSVEISLLPGEYTVTEVTGDQYEPQDTQKIMVVAGKTVTVTFNNTLKRGSLKVTKTAEDGLTEGVKFHLYGTSLSGIVVDEYAVTDKSGIAVFENVLIGSGYVLEEVDTADWYIVPGKQNATIEWNKVTEKSFENLLKRGAVYGKKVDEDGFTIAGATFGLFRPEETEFTAENAVLTAVSNEVGVFAFENIPYGGWIIRELSPAPAFILNDTLYPVTILDNNQIVEIEVVNRFITGSVETTKVDAEYPENKLSGAVFEIFVDVDGNQEFDPAIDMAVGEMTEVEAGLYRMDSLRYNGYFLHEKTAPEGFLADEGYYYFEIREDGEVVTVENAAGIGFTNQPGTGTLKLSKTDVADGKPLPNAGFRIKDEDGNVVVEGYTDENGVAVFTLRFGKYTYEEFDAPEGYLVDNAPHTFEITQDGQIVKAEMTNEKEPDIPQTGDDSKLCLWLGLAAVALGGLIACGIFYFKKKGDAM